MQDLLLTCLLYREMPCWQRNWRLASLVKLMSRTTKKESALAHILNLIFSCLPECSYRLWHRKKNYSSFVILLWVVCSPAIIFFFILHYISKYKIPIYIIWVLKYFNQNYYYFFYFSAHCLFVWLKPNKIWFLQIFIHV